MLPKEILLMAKSASLTRASGGAPTAVRPRAGRSEVSGSGSEEEASEGAANEAAEATTPLFDASRRSGRLCVRVLEGVMCV